MSVEVKFQQDTLETKRYHGKPGNWPAGVYLCHDGPSKGCVIARGFGSCLVIHRNLSFSTEGKAETSSLDLWHRVSKDSGIASITFAGSMNYPDGQPEGGAM